jgi:hypothetical protein
MPIIPAIQEVEVEMGKIPVQVQPRQKVSTTPSQNKKLNTVAHTWIPSHMGGTGIRGSGLWSKASTGQKYNKSKNGWRHNSGGRHLA